MAVDIPFEETLDGVKIQYLTDWNFSLSRSVTFDGKRMSTEKLLRGYAPRLRPWPRKRATNGRRSDRSETSMRKGSGKASSSTWTRCSSPGS